MCQCVIVDEKLLLSCMHRTVTVTAFTRFETDQYDKVPFFMFGDYNFRLDTNQLVKVCLCFTSLCHDCVVSYLI